MSLVAQNLPAKHALYPLRLTVPLPTDHAYTFSKIEKLQFDIVNAQDSLIVGHAHEGVECE